MPLLLGWSREEVHFIAERGYGLYRQGQLHEAAVLFEGLVAVDPQNVYCRKAAAAIYFCLGEHRMAVRHLDAVLAHDSLDVDALARRCEAWIAAGDIPAARRDFDSLAALSAGAENTRRLRLRLIATAGVHGGALEVSQLPSGSLR